MVPTELLGLGPCLWGPRRCQSPPSVHPLLLSQMPAVSTSQLSDNSLLTLIRAHTLVLQPWYWPCKALEVCSHIRATAFFILTGDLSSWRLDSDCLSPPLRHTLPIQVSGMPVPLPSDLGRYSSVAPCPLTARCQEVWVRGAEGCGGG